MIEYLVAHAHQLDFIREAREREQRRVWRDLEAVDRLSRALTTARTRLAIGGYAPAGDAGTRANGASC